MWFPDRLYSQNFEDLYLHRFFSSVEKGFYIDAGAWHPSCDSVTKIFYDQGWTGINIDPIAEVIDLFCIQRPNDINLNVAVKSPSDPQSLPLMTVGSNPLESGQHSVLSALPQSDDPSIRIVPGLTLFDIIKEHAPSRSIDFLKLDVEGFELNALTGLQLPLLSGFQRPKIIMFEATLTDSPSSSPHRQECRQLLENNSYQFLFTDALNDYFCDARYFNVFSELVLPPNIFDNPSIHCSNYFDFRNSTANSSERISELEAELLHVRKERDGYSSKVKSLTAKLSSARKKADLTLKQLHQLQEELEFYFLKSCQSSEILDNYENLQSRILSLLVSTISHD